MLEKTCKFGKSTAAAQKCALTHVLVWSHCKISYYLRTAERQLAMHEMALKQAHSAINSMSCAVIMIDWTHCGIWSRNTCNLRAESSARICVAFRSVKI